MIGDYRLLRVIGNGSFSIVRLGVHILTNQMVAVKIILKNMCNDQFQIDQMIERIRVLERLNHPGVIKLFEFIEDENAY